MAGSGRMIHFQCPVCGRLFKVADNQAGKKGKCSGCGQRVKVPMPPAKTKLGLFVSQQPDGSHPATATLNSQASGSPTPAAAHEPEAGSKAQLGSCPACGQALQLSPDAQDGWVRCPMCQTVFQVSAAKPVTSDPTGGGQDGPHVRSVTKGLTAGPGQSVASARVDDSLLERPGLVQAVALMTLMGGVWALVWALGLALWTCVGFIWPGTYYNLVSGVFCIVTGASLLGERRAQRPPRVTAILQIVSIVDLDVVNLALGVATLVFLSDRRVRRYFGGGRTD